MSSTIELRDVSLAALRESPMNPRKRYPPGPLAELAASIKEKGILTPLTVRPMPASRWSDPQTPLYEIGAGHRRYRAGKLGGRESVPCFVREMDDVDFLELLVIENDQREDVHPLEQAAGYKALMLQDGYDAKRIADRIGRSEKFVYDRVKLLQLTKEAQALFFAGKLTAGHAILLARLSAADQARALEVSEGGYNGGRGGLWQDEGGLDLFEEETAEKRLAKDPLAKFDGFKAVSVREFDSWIDEHVRFDVTKADPVLFPAATAATAEAPKPLIPITHNHYVQEEARDGKVRTYGPASWKDATKKTCPYAQGAVIVVGEGRGDVLQVCLSSHRDRCATHWAKEKKEAEARRKMMARGGGTSRADNSYEKQEEQRRASEAKREAVRARFKKALPKILEAMAAAIDKAPLAQIAQVVLEAVTPDRYSLAQSPVKLTDVHQPGKTAESLLRHAAFCSIFESASAWRAPDELPRAGKAWGLDVWGIVNKEAPAPKLAAQTSAKATPKKKTAKR
jgi:ParB/RepB/Spo0J family partition protein